MSINNLHSLLNGKWFIDQSYGQSLLPSLSLLLAGKPILKVDKVEESFLYDISSKTLSNASSFNPLEDNNEYVLMVGIKNPIYKYSQNCGPSGTKSKQQLMEQHRNNENCKGVVFDMDSGGGQVSGTPEFHDYIKEYPKPTVTYTDGLLCSAAYYIASATDYIIANKRADAIGSIGTMISFIDSSGILKKKGATIITEYATKSTDKNKDFEELLKGNPESYIKNQLDPITDTFHEDVLSCRPSLNKEVLTGGTYNANESLKLGLINELGTKELAVSKVFELNKENLNKKNTPKNTSIKMSKTKILVPAIQNVLGYEEGFGSNENGVFLQETELNKVEDALTNAATNVSNLETQVSDAAAITNDANTSINSALDNAEIAYTAENTLTEKINLLNEQRNEFATNASGAITKLPVEANKDAKNTPTNMVGNLDITAALNN
ncbi:S49 family peptidase [Tenacibaculum ovolyticum]|uniref:S49 family peptidase n=1 Tax=Tenacibaculum ovolyticum TaxID=104270 RepID=UPI0007EDA7D5|nr:S49 family peptidase [Tenacibaculum ovolyticum]